jgi:signal transduction histidine kinase
MKVQTSFATSAGRVIAWLLAPVALVGVLVIGDRIVATGHPYSETLRSAGAAPFVVSILACWLVGVVLTWRVVGNIVGWLFLALGTSITVSGLTDAYAEYALRAAPGSLPLGKTAAVLGDASFAWWFLFLALCLQLTPTGRPLTPRWRPVVFATVVSGLVFQFAALLRSTPLEGANADLVSPLALASMAGPMAALAATAMAILGICLLASVYAIVARFRHSRGEEHRQMLWLVVGVAPLPLCLLASFLAAYTDHASRAGWSVAVGVLSLAVGAGFSIVKYRLYGVEEVVGQAVAYVVATTAVILAYGVVVLVITGSIPGVSSGSTATTVLATLAAAGVALPAYRWVRTVVDRRFNRRRFDAVRMIRTGLKGPSPDLGLLMIEALGDLSVRILFPAGAAGWVSSDGREALPGGNVIDVVRRDITAARIEFDPRRSDPGVVEAVAREAAAEIDNLGLRAELARQLQQIRESRSRLAGAHLEERRRMERDLHDGAQQRLLAIALQLQSARVNGADAVLREEVDRAVVHLGSAVQELRDLASGLQPAALSGGGLQAALEELAARTPLRMDLQVIDRRFAPAVEGAAWFVIAEAVSNVVKHAGVDTLLITISVEASQLHVAVSDGGVGGADKLGRGLQGLADRVAALGGTLAVHDREPHGTKVEAWFPCAS